MHLFPQYASYPSWQSNSRTSSRNSSFFGVNFTQINHQLWGLVNQSGSLVLWPSWLTPWFKKQCLSAIWVKKKTYHTPIGPQKSWLRIKSQSLNPKVGEISQNAYHLPTGHPENCGFALLVNSPSHLIIAKPNVRRMEKRAGTTLKSYTRCI